MSTTDRSVATAAANASDDAVAVTRPELVAPGLRRAVAAVATASFLLIVFGHALVDLLAPVPAPTLIGAEKQQQDSRRANARFADGTLAKLVEEDLRLTSRVRRLSLAVYSPLLLRLFGIAGPDKIVGADLFFYLKDRLAVPAVAAASREQVIGRAVGRIVALSRYLSRLGSHVVAMPLPRKEVIAAANLPRGVDPHADYDRELIAGLLASGVDAVDLLQEYEQGIGIEAYLPADSHWSTAGQIAAARAVVRRLQPDKAPREVRFLEQRVDNRGFLAYTLGLDPASLPFLPARQIVVHHLAQAAMARCSVDAPTQGDPPLMLVGTSFSAKPDNTATLFGEALSALLDQPVWSAARPGRSAPGTLADGLATIRGRPYPTTIVMEMPNHQLVCHPTPVWDLAAVFAQLPIVPGLQSLVDRSKERFSIPPFLDGSKVLPGHLELPPGPRLVSRILEGMFVYPRDGTVLLQLRGKVQGTVEVVADVGYDGIYMRWPDWRQDLLVPFAGDRIGSTFDVVVAGIGAPASLELESIDVVCDLDLAGGVAGQGQGPVAVEGGWRQEFEFAGTPGADACLGIVLDGGDGQLDVTVDVDFGAAMRERLLTRSVRGKASLLLPLGTQPRQLRSATLVGTGPVPPRPARAFHLQRLPR